MRTWYFTNENLPYLMFRVIEPTAQDAMRRLCRDDGVWKRGRTFLHVDLTEDQDPHPLYRRWPFQGWVSDLAKKRMKKVAAEESVNGMVLMENVA